MKHALTIFFLITFTYQAFAQIKIKQGPPQEPQPITKNEIHSMVKNLADSIAINYTNEQKALMIKDKLIEALKAGKYDQYNNKQALAQDLSQSLRTWSDDKHFGIMLSGQGRVMPRSYSHFANQNFFFEKMEMLKGNIAYIKFNRFIPQEYAGSLYVSAMLFSANSSAIIIDLRDNMGGSPQTAGLLASFFMKERTLLGVNEVRATGEKYETWTTEAKVSINTLERTIPTTDLEKLKSLPVYILTSDYTFSAAEMFCSSLQGYDRATVVGEVTGGGGHSIRPFSIANGFTAFIPFARHYHPKTKECWEKVGIQPDIKCESTDALKKAQIEIIKGILKSQSSNTELVKHLKELEDRSLEFKD